MQAAIKNLRSEQGVDERRGSRTAEHDQHAEEEQQQNDRRQPPLLVVADEVPELAEESAGLTLGLAGKVAGIGFVVLFDAHVDLGRHSCRKYRSGLEGSQSIQYDFAERLNARRIGSCDNRIRYPIGVITRKYETATIT